MHAYAKRQPRALNAGRHGVRCTRHVHTSNSTPARSGGVRASRRRAAATSLGMVERRPCARRRRPSRARRSGIAAASSAWISGGHTASADPVSTSVGTSIVARATPGRPTATTASPAGAGSPPRPTSPAISIHRSRAQVDPSGWSPTLAAACSATTAANSPASVRARSSAHASSCAGDGGRALELSRARR